jgi:hypothetical protein
MTARAEGGMSRKGEPVRCPFCARQLARPAAIDHGPGEVALGGRCACGALYLLDASGREGGQRLVDGLAALCAGDIARAMSLRAGVDYEVHGLGYNPRGHCLEHGCARRGGAFGLPKLWCFRLLAPAPTGEQR